MQQTLVDWWHFLVTAVPAGWWQGATLPAWIAAIATVGYLIITYRLFTSTRDFNEASTRPFIAIQPVVAEGTMRALAVTFEFSNIGRLPASTARLSIVPMLNGADWADNSASKGPNDIFPGQVFELYMRVPEDIFDGIAEKNVELTVRAQAEYAGVTGKRHGTALEALFSPELDNFTVKSSTHT